MTRNGLPRRLAAEATGTAWLVATVIGSGIMAERLAAGNDALALLGNTFATGAMLVVLITVLGPISGAHLNPAVSFAFALRGELARREAGAYAAAQTVGAIAGAVLAHAMFEVPLLATGATVRTGYGQWLSEGVAALGLIGAILGTLAARPRAVAAVVGLYISAAYWFTASTSFANPAVTIGRALTDTFSGIEPRHAPAFIAAQLVGAALGTWLFRCLQGRPSAPARID